MTKSQYHPRGISSYSGSDRQLHGNQSSLVNGFERKFRGMWAVGAMVQIPIWNWGEGMYKVKLPKRKQTLPAINWQMQKKR